MQTYVIHVYIPQQNDRRVRTESHYDFVWKLYKLTRFEVTILLNHLFLQVVGYDITKYPHVTKWLAKSKTSLPGYAEANEKGVQMFKGMYEALTKKA